MKEILTQTGFDKLLSTLDADRDAAGAKYESLRARLIKFFEWRNCETAEELTDTVLDRVMKKIAGGEDIKNVSAYAATVAQFVFKEDLRRREKLFRSIEDAPEIAEIADEKISREDETETKKTDCLTKCLAEFSAENRRVIVEYYSADERTMIAARQRLADEMKVSLNVLRIRVCRLKSKLENCTRECCNEI